MQFGLITEMKEDMMKAIHDSFINALLADATYALGNQANLIGATGNILAGFLSDRMTPALAEYIGKNFTVVTHIETGDIIESGFDATVWKDNNTGKLYVSMQGTVGLADFSANVSLAALNGAAGTQLVDMVNWWLCISTPEGEMAQQIKILAYSPGADFLFVNAPPVAGQGLITAEDLEKGIEVNGHSLGGYLASAFSRLFPDVTDSAVAINGAGFDFDNSNVDVLFAALGGADGFNAGKIINLIGSAGMDLVSHYADAA